MSPDQGVESREVVIVTGESKQFRQAGEGPISPKSLNFGATSKEF